MTFDQLHPAGFVETGGCTGPRLIRNQESRETPGILLEEKYLSIQDPQLDVDFNLPFKSAVHQSELLKFSWDKLDKDQRTVILSKLNFLDLVTKDPKDQDSANENNTDNKLNMQIGATLPGGVKVSKENIITVMIISIIFGSIFLICVLAIIYHYFPWVRNSIVNKIYSRSTNEQ